MVALSTSTKFTLVFAALAILGDANPLPDMIGSIPRRAVAGKAVYFITNAAQNSVVALSVKSDGTLAPGKSTQTGGAGAVMLDAASGKPQLPDGMASQSSLTRVDNHIFAVNAGSNTLSMLAINPKDPTCLTMVGKPVAVPGEFPNTVAASPEHKMVCVAMTGSKAGVSCTSFSKQGLGVMDDLRPFEIGQSTPPKGPLNTVSQTLFSADGTKLFTMVKGDPTANNTGFISAFDVQRGQNGRATLARSDQRMSPNGTAVLFGTTRIPGSQSLFATDASFGAAVLRPDQKGQVTVAGMGKIDGQKATCWTTISPATNSAFVTDVATDRIVEMSMKDASIIKEYNLSANHDLGHIDIASAGNFVYALSPGNATVGAAMIVMDVSGGQGTAKQAQRLNISRLTSSSAQGLAVM